MRIPWANITDPATLERIKSFDPDKKSPLTDAEFQALSPAERAVLDQIVKLAVKQGFLPNERRKSIKAEKAGTAVETHAVEGLGAGDHRKYSNIGTIVSKENVVEPLFPDSLVPSGKGNYNEELLKAIKEAKKFVFVEGYEIDRDDIVDLLIQKAQEGVQVVALFDPAETPQEKKKAALLDKMRALKLKNLQVAEYAVIEPSGARDREQILHIKKTICDTPDGGIVELSGGINFNKNSLKNFDTAWRTYGVAAIDSLSQLVQHFKLSTGHLPFDLSVVPSVQRMRARVKALGVTETEVELAAAGRTPVETPRDYSLAKLRERAKLGRKIIISSQEVVKSGIAGLLELAVQNKSSVTVVEELMSDPDKDTFAELKAGLAKLGIKFVASNAIVKEESYQKLVYRELDAAIDAGESIDVAAFCLSDREVIDRLVIAHQKGCKVRVLVDDLTIDGAFLNQKAIEMLTAVGIPVKAVDPKAKQALAAQAGTSAELLKLHAKIVVLGGNRVLGGSANFSQNGLTNNVEDGRMVRSTAVAKAYTEKLVDFLWKHASDVEKTELVDDTQRVSFLPNVPLNTSIHDCVFVVFDFETTGFVPGHGERILSMGAQAVKIEKDGTMKVLDKINLFVTPGRNAMGNTYSVPQQSARVHKLTNAELEKRGAKPMREMLPKFLEFFTKQAAHGKVVPVGQNVVFDLRHLDFAMRRKALGQDQGGKRVNFTCDMPFVDTVDVSTYISPEEAEHKLDALMKRYGVPEDPTLPRHDAFADVVYTAQSLAAMAKHAGFKTLGELIGPDSVQFEGPTLVAGSKGGPAVEQLEFDDKKKLVVRAKDKATGKFGDATRVRVIDVLALDGDEVKIRVTTGTGQNATSFEGYVPAKQLSFRSPGKVYYALREKGAKLMRPQVLRT